MSTGFLSAVRRIYGAPYPRLIELLLASMALWMVSILPTLAYLAGAGNEAHSVWGRWQSSLGSLVENPVSVFSEMGLWLFGPVADCPLALPILILIGGVAAARGCTIGVRTWGALSLAAGVFALAWVEFGTSAAGGWRLPIYVEPVIGAGASAIAGVAVLSTIRIRRRRRPWMSVLPALTAVSLLVILPTVVTAGPVSAYAHMVGGDLLVQYAVSGGKDANVALTLGLRISGIVVGVPVLFLTVLLAVKRLPLSQCVSQLLSSFGRRPFVWSACIFLLAFLAFPVFLIATRAIWAEALAESEPENVAFLGTILTVFSGFLVGIYVYFAVRTVLVLTENPPLGPGVPVLPRTTVPFPMSGPSRHRRSGPH